MNGNSDAERSAESDRRVLRISTNRIAIEIDAASADKDSIDVVETTSHYTLASVSEIEGMTELVKNGTQRGSETPAVGTTIIAVVHQILGVDDGRVEKLGQYLSHARRPSVKAGRAEKRQSTAAKSSVTLSSREGSLVGSRIRSSPVPRAGEKSHVLPVPRGQRSGHQLTAEKLPELLLAHGSRTIDVQHAVHNETLRTVQITLQLECFPPVSGLSQFLGGQSLKEPRTQTYSRRCALR